MPLLIAGGAGILMGAAFLDLLPEAIALGTSAEIPVNEILGLTLASFLFFFLLDACLDRIASRDQAGRSGVVAGRVAASMLILHSLRDGMAIGASYAVSPIAGYTVAFGVAAHDFGDGLNTVLLTTRGKAATRSDYLFLLADALAPLAGGIAAAMYFSSLKDSVFLLAAAAGFFIEMAATDLLPELRSYASARTWAMVAVLAGAGMIYLANLLLRFSH